MNYLRNRHPWIFCGSETPLGARTLVSAILDLSPDAIPGKPDPDEVLARADDLIAHGADLVDVTVLPIRPSGKRISSDDELQRMVPTLRRLRSSFAVPFFVTTYNSGTAARALELKASGVYDPSGLTIDPLMARTLGNTDAALIIGHAPGGAESWPKPRPIPHVVEAVVKDSASAMRRALAGGVDRRRIVFCPGPGLGKRPDQSLELLEGWGAFAELGQPTMVSLAQDLFLAETVRASAEQWAAGSAAAAALAVRNGAHIARTTSFHAVQAATRLTDRLIHMVDEAE